MKRKRREKWRKGLSVMSLVLLTGAMFPTAALARGVIGDSDGQEVSVQTAGEEILSQRDGTGNTTVVESVKVHTFVRPAGHCLESLEVTVSDPSLLEGIEASDFTLEGEATKWMDSNLHSFTATVSDVTVDKDVFTLTITDFTEKYFYVDNFTVTCESNPALSFTSDLVTEVITPTADDFEQVRKADGAAFDYNIYIPDGADGSLPVVVAFHGFGDTDNLLQNQVAVSWAFPENQEKRPAIVIAPIIDQYFDAGYRDSVYTETYGLIQELIRDGKADENRIYVVGKSYGGLATYEFTEKYADDVAGAIALCGATTDAIIENAAKMADVPLYIVQAENDDTVNVESSYNMYKALTEAGSTKVQMKIYSDAEMNAAGVDGTVIGYHTVEMAALSSDYDGEKFMSWLFEQTNAEISVTGVKVHTFVRPAGHCLESLEVTVSDPSLLEGIEASDFTLKGEAAKWMDPDLHSFTATVSDVSVDGDVFTLTITDFTEKYFYVDNFTVTCESNPALSFTSDLVTEVITPTADDFEQVRKADGAAFDYNIYIPDGADESLPVVVAFHGYGDTDNLLQNQVAVSWAFPENQEKRPAIVIAPIIDQYFDAGYRDSVYTETYGLIQELIRDGKADENRIYVVGKSYGGLATYEFTEKYAADIAGAIALCGATTDAIIENAAKMADVPLYIVQAENDDTVDVISSYKMYHALMEAGSTEVQMKIYSDAEMNAAGVDGTVIGYHTVEMAALSSDYDGEKFMSWLFEQTNAETVQTDPGTSTDPAAPENPAHPSGDQQTTNRTPAAAEAAKTGDTSSAGVWAALCCAAAAAAVVAVYRKRRDFR